MAYREFYYRWEWHFESRPEQLWPLVADTNTFDRDTGLAPLEHRPDENRVPNARIKARFKQFGIVPIAYEQEPFQWNQPHRFSIMRRFSLGPVASMRVVVSLNEEPSGGTHLVYEIWARPANALGLIAIPLQIGVISKRSFDKVFRRYDRLASVNQNFLDKKGRVEFTSGGKKRLELLRVELLELSGKTDSVEKLVDLLREGDSFALSAIRPYELADHWGTERREMLELCLLATRIGMLDFTWDLLCPLCRGAKDSQASLGGVKSEIHCTTCNIDFEVNFEQSVEVTFSPNPAIREVDSGVYCINTPMSTPHVAVQQLLAAGAVGEAEPQLEPGRYRLRTLELRGGQSFEVIEGGLSEITLRAVGGGWSGEEQQVSPSPKLHLYNETDEEQLFILERMAWTDQAATAAEVTVLQRFRDLFADEALRPGEQISVGSLTILFTDLRGSTDMYRKLGDAPAFGLVMDHFDVLKAHIDREGGSIVKTIGDAVMAVFRQPVHGMRALLAAREEIEAIEGAGVPLQLKVGIHYGACIAVSLNDRLDYFGSTVNIAARLESLSKGTELVISDAVRFDPEVVEYLEESADWLEVKQVETTLRGFEEKRFSIWLVGLRE